LGTYLTLCKRNSHLSNINFKVSNISFLETCDKRINSSLPNSFLVPNFSPLVPSQSHNYHTRQRQHKLVRNHHCSPNLWQFFLKWTILWQLKHSNMSPPLDFDYFSLFCLVLFLSIDTFKTSTIFFTFKSLTIVDSSV
jgi:hypothetical protein